VILYVNKVGPYYNPQETYEFYDKMPLCPPEKKIQSRLEGLGEALQGYELIQSNLKFYFKGIINSLFPIPTSMRSLTLLFFPSCLDNSIQNKVFCSLTLTREHVNKFTSAVKQRYWYEFFLGTTY